MDPNNIVAVCQSDYAANSGDCNAFVKAVDSDLGFNDFSAGDNADAIVTKLQTSSQWSQVADGVAAKAAADGGGFVIGGMRSTDFNPRRANGHVVVVVAGPLAQGKYPTAYWGSLGGPPSGPVGSTINFSFAAPDRDRVLYFQRS
jgi:hypothetical protein